MAGYIDLNGVRTWYDVAGDGDPLVLFHPGGAGVDSRAWSSNIAAFRSRFRTYTPDRRAHGRTPDVEGPITFDAMAADMIAFIEKVVGEPADLVGCSDGAIVALLTALRRPDLVRRLVFVAAPFHLGGWLPGVIDSDEEPPEFLRESYAEISPDGPDHYPVVVEKLARMHQEGPTLEPGDLERLEARTLVMAADDDEVELEHVLAMYRAIPDAELAVIPGTSHGLLVEKPELCNQLIVDFLTSDPVETLAPVRRRGAR
ncbi:MAG: alpha/beta hydrolase [Aldersonia sp.]|nr:alpha/beta hydrolase [Aldersonia sp.]